MGRWSENLRWRRPLEGVSSTFFRTYLYVRKARAKRFIAADFSAKTSMGDQMCKTATRIPAW